jgi:hypothetical protein
MASTQITNERGGEEARRVPDQGAVGTGGEGGIREWPASLIRDTASLTKMEKRHPEASGCSGKWNPLLPLSPGCGVFEDGISVAAPSAALTSLQRSRSRPLSKGSESALTQCLEAKGPWMYSYLTKSASFALFSATLVDQEVSSFDIFGQERGSQRACNVIQPCPTPTAAGGCIKQASRERRVRIRFSRHSGHANGRGSRMYQDPGITC